ncbi:DUF6249 domain-containing protein [Inhella sp.]|uniref:DUF6249 domain-containing protein n=1 Tax=Inhella sp. TaxID=1921806 RepID=UPI0035AECDE8
MDTDILRENFPLLIPILALLIPIVAIVAHYVAKSNRERERHETIRMLVKAGQPIPPELLSAVDAQDSDWQKERRSAANPNRSLIPGVINLSVGIGLAGMFSVMKPESWLWAIGLVPACLGLGFIFLWLVERKQQPTPPANG